MSKMNTIVPPNVNRVMENEPDLAMAIMTASMHQAITSPNAAILKTKVPRGVFCKALFFMIRAKTGKAVILKEMPIKMEKTRKETPGIEKFGKR